VTRSVFKPTSRSIFRLQYVSTWYEGMQLRHTLRDCYSHDVARNSAWRGNQRGDVDVT